jgi:hypothetical protein
MKIRVFLHYMCDEAIWVTWLYFHPFTHFALANGSVEYQQKRSEIITRFCKRLYRGR